MREKLSLLAVLLLASPLGADDAPTVAERLGYPADARLLIVHADDLGVNHSTNRAFADAWPEGVVTSGSILVPAPWFPEIADFARNHPEADLGLHLALTAEWRHLRWGPVADRGDVPSLLDDEGFLPATAAPVAEHARREEVEAELRAQVERAKAFGIEPTHLDSHMGTLFQTPELLGAYLAVAESYRLPALLPPELRDEPWLAEVDLGRNAFWATQVLTITPDVDAKRWWDYYRDVALGLPPGLTVLLIHLAYDDAETRAMTTGHVGWGAAWRQRDVDVFTSRRFRRLLEKSGVRLVTWREVGKLLAQ